MKGIENMPINSISWVPRAELHANNYNPNHVAPPELELLKISILEDGWTQPIVAKPDGEIVDGFHRWLVSGKPEIYALTDGYVPVVRLENEVSKEQQMMATIRHNRARGTHHVLKIADIVREMIDIHKLPMQEVMKRLQMEEEEVERLYDRAGMKKRGRQDNFNNGWVPK